MVCGFHNSVIIEIIISKISWLRCMGGELVRFYGIICGYICPMSDIELLVIQNGNG